MFRRGAGQYYSGIQTVLEQEYRDWMLTVECHQVGTTIRRTKFSVRLQAPDASQIERLVGFPSPQRALDAAHRRIDFIIDIQTPHRPRRRRRAQKFWQSTQVSDDYKNTF